MPPIMKEPATSLCRCKQKPCSCIRSTLVSGPPLVYNNFSELMSQTGVYQPYPLLLCGREVLQSVWSRPNGEYVEMPHAMYSSEQEVRECIPVSRHTESGAPISPPVSTSSPLPKDPDDQNNAKAPIRGQKKYVCETCKHAFDYKHVLQNHKRIHTGEKPFACDQCSKRFTRDHHLKTHIRLHTGEKPYKCDYCDKTFVQIANKRRHIRVHTGERPYKCQYPTCRSTFSDSHQLKAHALIHTNEKPFVGPNYNQRYPRRTLLKGYKCPNENGCTNGGDTVITNEPDAIMDESEDSKTILSDATVSNDSCLSPGCRMLPSGGLYQPWAPTTPVMPTDAINLSSLVLVIPEQTEPEDLSVKTKYHSTNNNNSSDSAGDSSWSTSPLDELSVSPRFVH